MSEEKITPMTPFDCRISNQALQMVKLLLPYFPPYSQRSLAVLIKFIELQSTLSSFRSFRTKSNSMNDILSEIHPYLSTSISETLDFMQNMMSILELFHTMNEQSGDTPGGNPMDWMKQMLSPEQQEMFDFYNMMFSEQEPDKDQEGGDMSD